MTVLLFAGDGYYPAGGWDDYVGTFDTIDDAKAHIDSRTNVVHVPERMEPPVVHALCVTTNPSTGVRGPRIIRAHYRIDAPFDWAHIVEDDGIVMRWPRHYTTLVRGDEDLWDVGT